MDGRKSNVAEAPAKRERFLKRICAALHGGHILATEEEWQALETARRSMHKGSAKTWDLFAICRARG